MQHRHPQLGRRLEVTDSGTGAAERLDTFREGIEFELALEGLKDGVGL